MSNSKYITLHLTSEEVAILASLVRDTEHGNHLWHGRAEFLSRYFATLACWAQRFRLDNPVIKEVEDRMQLSFPKE